MNIVYRAEFEAFLLILDVSFTTSEKNHRNVAGGQTGP